MARFHLLKRKAATQQFSSPCRVTGWKALILYSTIFRQAAWKPKRYSKECGHWKSMLYGIHHLMFWNYIELLCFCLLLLVKYTLRYAAIITWMAQLCWFPTLDAPKNTPFDGIWWKVIRQVYQAQYMTNLYYTNVYNICITSVWFLFVVLMCFFAKKRKTASIISQYLLL